MQETLTPEERLVLLAARRDLRPRDERALLALLAAPLDWEAVESRASSLLVEPLLARHLSRRPFAGAVPGRLIGRFQAAYRESLLRNLRHYGHLREILTASNRAGIPVALLKGAFLARFVYRDIALRPMLDLDLLIPEQDAGAFQSMVSGLGYGLLRPPGAPRNRVHARLPHDGRLNHLPPLYHPRKARVEAHLFAFPRGWERRGEMEHLWRTALPATLDGRLAYRLSPEWLLLHLLIHMGEHRKACTRLSGYWMVDIHEVVCRYGDAIRWDAVLSRADRMGVGEETRSLLGLVRQGWETPLPESVLDGRGAASRGKAGDALRPLLSACLETGAARSGPGAGYYLGILRQAGRLDTPRERLLYWLGFLFPSRAYIAEQYRVSGRLALWGRRLYHPWAVCGRFLSGFLRTCRASVRTRMQRG